MPRIELGAISQQSQLVIEPLGESVDAKTAYPAGGQFQRQRHAIEPPTDRTY
jgi:hypothetical protein